MKTIKLGSIVFLISLVFSLSLVYAYQYYFATNFHQVQSGLVLLGATITVPDDYMTIQKAINAASDGDTVFVRNGTYYENVVVNKSVSLVGENRSTTVIDGNFAGNVVIISANNVTFSDFTVQHSKNYPDAGIYVSSAQYCSVTGNKVVNNWLGINVFGSSDNIIAGNSMAYNSYGVGCGQSASNRLFQNNMTSNWYGIVLDGSYSNNISSNNIANNTLGIHIGWSRWNIIYHNNFLNGHQVHIYESYNNVWDNGCEGNYWSNYNGTDLNEDGIGDEYLPWEGVDNYPLMNPYWNPADINHDLEVDIFDVVAACAAYSSNPIDSNWNCHCDITEPYGIINIFDIVTICSSYGEEYTP